MPNNQFGFSDPRTHAAQRAQNPWFVLVDIWKGKYPPESPQPKTITLAVKLAVTPVLILRRLSPSTAFRKEPPDFIDGMVIIWTLCTTAILAISTPWDTGFAALLACCFAWFRVLDTVSQKAMEILVHSIRPPLLAGIQRGVVLGALNLYEIIAAYAIIYLLLGDITNGAQPLSTPTAALYFSTVTALTVGFGDFAPANDIARVVVISQIAGTAIFILAWFPRIVALLFPTATPRGQSPN